MAGLGAFRELFGTAEDDADDSEAVNNKCGIDIEPVCVAGCRLTPRLNYNYNYNFNFIRNTLRFAK